MADEKRHGHAPRPIPENIPEDVKTFTRQKSENAQRYRNYRNALDEKLAHRIDQENYDKLAPRRERARQMKIKRAQWGQQQRNT